MNGIIVEGNTLTIGHTKIIVKYPIKKIEKINGNYYLTDKKSTNHTYLNGEILEPERAYVLSDNDNIRIADEEFIFFLN